MKLSQMQILFCAHARELGLKPVCEYPVCDGRRWRFDIAFPYLKLAVEIHGGQYSGGHRRSKKEGKRGTAQEDEYDKLRTATMLGWKVLQFSNEEVSDGRAQAFLIEWVNAASR